MIAKPALPHAYLTSRELFSAMQNVTEEIKDVTVCLRPFRSAGPRLEMEGVGSKTVLHNYGHGGSGWSLSWGYASAVVQKLAEVTSAEQRIAVIGCGAIGLTSAIAAQRAGLRVTIYAKDHPRAASSSKATGTWTPDSRVALTQSVEPNFANEWEATARIAFRQHESYLKAFDDPVNRTDLYRLYDSRPELQTFRHSMHDSHGFVFLEDKLRDMTPLPEAIDGRANPFTVPFATRASTLTFNLTAYTEALITELHARGGSIERRTLSTPQDLLSFDERVVVDCSGYGARRLWSDESIIPIRGQIALLPARSNVHFGLLYNNLRVLARSDGVVVQPSPTGDDTGWNQTDESPDWKVAHSGVEELLRIKHGMKSVSP